MDQTQAARYICRALRETVDVAADWAYGERARETLVNGGDSALTPSGSEDHDPERDPVSIHTSLYTDSRRFWSTPRSSPSPSTPTDPPYWTRP